MSAPAESTFTMSHDGFDVAVDRYLPSGTARAAIIIAHGMAEHAARYQRFAHELAERGHAVYAPDHRGHGRTSGSAENLGWAGADGWNGMLRDLQRVADRVRQEQPGIPLVMFGHSMGSVLAQRFAQLHGDSLGGLMLSGTFGSAPNIGPGIAAAQTVRLLRGDRAPSPLQRTMFADFNKAFSAQPGFDWLSRDEAEVRKYVDDPRCGFTFSNRTMLEMLRGYVETWKRENERRIPAGLPVLLLSGALDPVGRNTQAVTELADRYRALSLGDVEVIFYPDGRHEMLNETNRDEVVRDILGWLETRLPKT